MSLKGVKMTSLSPHAEEGTEIETNLNRSFPSPCPPPAPHLDESSPWLQSNSQPPPPPPASDPPLKARGNLQRCKDNAQKLETEYAKVGFYSRKNASSALAVSASASALSSSEQEQQQYAVFYHNQVTKNQHLFNHSTELQRGSAPIYFPLSGHENNIGFHVTTMSSKPSHRVRQLSSTLPRYDLPPQDGLCLPHSHGYQRPLSMGVAFNMTDESGTSAEPSYQSINKAFNFIDDVRAHRVPHNNSNATCMDRLFPASKLAETGRYCTLQSSMPQNSSLAMMDSRIGVKSASTAMITSSSTFNTSANHIHESESALEPAHLAVAADEKHFFSCNSILSTSKIDGSLVQTKPNIVKGKDLSSSNPNAVIGGAAEKNSKNAMNEKRKGSNIFVPNKSVDDGAITMKPVHMVNKHGLVDVFSSYFFASQTHPTVQIDQAAYEGMCKRWWKMTPEDKNQFTDMAIRLMGRYQKKNPAIDETCSVRATHGPSNSIVPNNLGNGFLPTTSAFNINAFGKNSVLAPDFTPRNTNTSARRNAFPHGLAWEGMKLSENTFKQRFGNESDLMERLREPRNSAEHSLSSSISSHADVFDAGGYAGEKYVAHDVPISDTLSSIRSLETSSQSTEFNSSEMGRIGVACIDNSKAASWRQPTCYLPSQEPVAHDESKDAAPPHFAVEYHSKADEIIEIGDLLWKPPQSICAPIVGLSENPKWMLFREPIKEGVPALKAATVRKKTEKILQRFKGDNTIVSKEVMDSDGFLHELDENGARTKPSQEFEDLRQTEEGSQIYKYVFRDFDQSNAKNSFMESKIAEVILNYGQDDVVNGDGEGKTERKTKRHVENVEFVAKKTNKRGKIEKVPEDRKPHIRPSQKEMSTQTRPFNEGTMITLKNPRSFSSMSSEDIMSTDTRLTRELATTQIYKSTVRGKTLSPPPPPILSSVEAMSAYAPPCTSAWEGIKVSVLKDACRHRKLMVLGNKSNLVKRLQNHITEHKDTAERSSSSSAACCGDDSANSAIIDARQEYVSNDMAMSDAVSSIRPLEKSPPSAVFRSNEIVSDDVNQSEVTVVFQCSICANDFCYTKPNTAAASFSNHVRRCKREKRKALKRKRTQIVILELKDSSPCSPNVNDENGMFERAKRTTRHRQHQATKTISRRNMISSLQSDTGSVGVKDDKQRLQTKSTLSPLKNDENQIKNRSRAKSKQESSSDAKEPKNVCSSYSFFASLTCPTILEERFRKRSVMTREQWSALTPEEKKPYVRTARRDRDKERSLGKIAAFEQKGTKLINLKSGPTEEIDGERARPSVKKNEDTLSKLFREETTNNIAQSSYPYAPMGHLWLDKSLSSSQSRYFEATVGHSNTDSGSTLIGRRWVWDEGYFVDAHLDPQTKKKGKSGCTCGSNHLFCLLNTIKNHQPSNDAKSPGGVRRSERSTYSSSVMAQLADGQLDPHTLITCEEYDLGPEYRFMKDPQTKNVQPFLVRVNPDATFLADLHAHICDSEIIGLLGGYYAEEEKCIYIQAAFPCKSTDRLDSGSTDVEMDPVFQMYATEAISNNGMRVVGWYHSHPDFQPNPSITDIENQANYQQLFQGGDLTGRNAEVSPFVGLIVGTYDGKNLGSQSVMRWFHVQRRETAECKSVNFPMNLRTTDRHYRKMTFDNQSIADNIRRSMTLRSSNIRQILESRYLLCPVSGLPGSQMTNVTGIPIYQYSANSLALEENFGEDNCIEQSEKSNEACSMAISENNNQNKNVMKCCSLLETGETPIQLSEALFNRAPETDRTPQVQLACPLYFNDNERSVFDIGHDTVPCDVFAGIIWFAVEREQLPKSDMNEHSQVSPRSPASSRSILDLLLRQSLSSSNMLNRKLYDMIHCLDDAGLVHQSVQLDGNDAAILHSLDAVLGHYAPKTNRINPFSSWSGAGDKGNIIKDYGSCSDPWVDFYLTTILKVEAVQTDEGRVYKGGVKMKRGHKIAACLLRWARNMQLSFNDEFYKRDRYPVNNSRDCAVPFDHEQKLYDLQVTSAAKVSYQERQYIYFVSEVMRLMVARWREVDPDSSKEG